MTARSLRSFVLAPIAVLALIGALGACTKSTPSGTSAPATTRTVTTPNTTPTGPLDTSAVTEKTASSCPFISFTDAKNFAGFRLDRITTLSQSGTLVGCRFYALQHPNAQCDQSCLSAERLPPANVPGIELLASHYANHTAAFNAMAVLADHGTSPQQFAPVAGNTGVCYQTTLWAHDDGKDWACDFTKGAELVVIRTVVTDPALNVIEIAQAAYPKM